MTTIESVLKHAEQIGKVPGEEQDQASINKIKIGMRVAIDKVQRWIPVSEHFPEDTPLINSENFESIRFLVKGTNGFEWIANRRKLNTGYRFISCESGHTFEVTHYRPIEIK